MVLSWPSLLVVHVLFDPLLLECPRSQPLMLSLPSTFILLPLVISFNLMSLNSTYMSTTISFISLSQTNHLPNSRQGGQTTTHNILPALNIKLLSSAPPLPSNPPNLLLLQPSPSQLILLRPKNFSVILCSSFSLTLHPIH